VTGPPPAGPQQPAGAARAAVLGRIAAALGPAGADATQTAAVPPGEHGNREYGYRERSDLTSGQLLDLLAGRLTDYRALVRRATAADLGSVVADALTARGVRRIVVPPALALSGLAGLEVTVDDQLTPAELDGFDGVVTRAAVAIAETGTIVLDGSPDQGRRAISLVPDYHLCIVAAGQVVHLVPEAVARLAGSAGQPLTWISGPSATSDIELERVEGVHGPRTLEVILVQD
jgi:L-lactate dehydrogenase complex protein LldG